MMKEEGITQIWERLREVEERVARLEGRAQQAGATPAPSAGGPREADVAKLAEAAGVTEDQIRCVFDFKQGSVTLIAAVGGKSQGERQFSSTVCLLAAYHYCYGKEEMRSQDLRSRLEWQGIEGLSHLSGNLGRHRDCIIPTGKSASPEFSYRITYPGLKAGLRVVRELCESAGAAAP